jgi:hypothetical protein
MAAVRGPYRILEREKMAVSHEGGFLKRKII